MKTENARVNYVIDKKTLEALKDYCYKTQLSASAVVRLALAAYLEKKAKEAKE